MSELNTDAVVRELVEGMSTAVEPYIGKVRQWAAEDQNWLKEQAQVAIELIKDLAEAVDRQDEGLQAILRDAQEQHLSTLKLRLLQRRIEATEAAKQAAGDALETGLRIAMKVGLAILTAGASL